MVQLKSPALACLAAAACLVSCATAFSFSADSEATQCGNITMSWSGGEAPYHLSLLPSFSTPRNISIPDDAYTNGEGSYSTQVPFEKGQTFIMTMSDSTGFGTGGSTNVLTVGAGDSSCNTTDPGVDFYFDLNSALTQCRTYEFSGYSGAVQPVYIYGVIPLGDSFALHPSKGSSSFNWTVDIYNGTNVMFFMVDSENHQGGASEILTVGTSDDLACINASSPSSTALPSATASSSSASSPGGRLSIGAVVGATVGVVVFLVTLIGLGLFFFKRWRNKKPSGRMATDKMAKRGSHVDLSREISHTDYPLQHNDTSPSDDPPSFPFMPPGGQYDAEPFLAPPSPTSHSRANSQSASHVYDSLMSDPRVSRGDSVLQSSHSRIYSDPFDPSGVRQSMVSSEMGSWVQTSGAGPSTVTPSQRKRAMASVSSYSSLPSRFVVHTDAEDAFLPQPNEDGVVELPPQYSPYRGPVGRVAASPNRYEDEPEAVRAASSSQNLLAPILPPLDFETLASASSLAENPVSISTPDHRPATP